MKICVQVSEYDESWPYAKLAGQIAMSEFEIRYAKLSKRSDKLF